MSTPHSTYDLVIESVPGETRAALMRDGLLIELLILRRTDPPRLGESYQGRVARFEHGFNAAFVDIGAGPPGFLPLSKAAQRLIEGAQVFVAIAAEAARGKGPRLTTNIPVADRTAGAMEKIPAQIQRETDLAALALCAFMNLPLDRIVADGAACFARVRAAARERKPDLGACVERHVGPEPAFDALGIEEQIENALAATVVLDSGLRLRFDEIEALTAIDIDAASYAPRRGSRATALSANLAAVDEIARQIRLRNLSGLILVDFLRMKDASERKRIAEAVARATTGDPILVHIHGFTRTGLLELTRERRRRPLSQVLLESDTPRLKSAETVAREALRAVSRARLSGRSMLALAAAPDVIAWLEGEGKSDVTDVEAALHVGLALRPVPDFPRDKFEIAPG